MGRESSPVVACVVALAFGAGCDEPRSDRLGARGDLSGVRVWHHECIQVPDEPKVDVLLVVDDSVSMCQEHGLLRHSLEGLGERLASGAIDTRVAVVTTDMADPARQGRFVTEPARENHPDCDRSCLEDAHCGGGCLCGVPWLRRCEADADCEPGRRCVAPAGGDLRHCADPCEAGDRCGAGPDERPVLVCRDVEGGRFCTLAPCAGDGDCGPGQRCLPGAEGHGWCRTTEPAYAPCRADWNCPLGVPCHEQPDGTGRCEPVHACPPATCDCPRDLPAVLGRDEPDLPHKLRCLGSVGTRGDDFEQGLEAMRAALSPPLTDPGGPNAGFLRECAELAVVFLSDENDCSDAGRLPRDEDPAVCEWRREELVPVGEYVGFLRGLKDDPTEWEWARAAPCEEDSDCHVGEFCSHKAGRCIDDRVLVAAVVGPKRHECVLSCPSEDPVLDCVPDPTCWEPCHVERGEGAFCADRVYEYDDPVRPTCTSVNGQAFNGRRYAELVDAFGYQGVLRSICGSEEDNEEALARLVLPLVHWHYSGFYLGRPLPVCTDDADCRPGFACLPPDGRSRSCLDPDGHPQALVLTVLDPLPPTTECAPVEMRPRTDPAPEWTFAANRGPGGFGCVQFLRHGPRRGSEVCLDYPSELLLD